VRVRLGRYDDAVAGYRAVLVADGKNVLALNNLAWLLAWQKEGSTEALELGNRAIQVAGPQAALLDTRAVVSMARGDAWSAIDDLEQAIAQAPSAARSFHLARAYALAGLAAKAADTLQQARALGLTPHRLHALEQTTYAETVEPVHSEPRPSRVSAQLPDGRGSEVPSSKR
jgi:cellulose synthase operon protein C